MIDARGLICPQPVIITKKELDKENIKQVETLVDNEIAVNNLKKLAESMGASAKISSVEDYFSVTILKGSEKQDAGNDDLTVVFFQNYLGSDKELGEILVKSFAYTMTEAAHRPKEILLLNSGVKLACSGSPVLESFKELVNKGVVINSCGLCLDFYDLKENLVVGGVTNMYDIYEKMAQAGHLIRI